MTPLNAKSYRRPVVKTNLYIVYANMAIYTKKMELNDMPHVNVVIWEMSSIPLLSPCILMPTFTQSCENIVRTLLNLNRLKV